MPTPSSLQAPGGSGDQGNSRLQRVPRPFVRPRKILAGVLYYLLGAGGVIMGFLLPILILMIYDVGVDRTIQIWREWGPYEPLLPDWLWFSCMMPGGYLGFYLWRWGVVKSTLLTPSELQEFKESITKYGLGGCWKKSSPNKPQGG